MLSLFSLFLAVYTTSDACRARGALVIKNCVKSKFVTNGLTDGLTDEWMDGLTDRPIESRST